MSAITVLPNFLIIGAAKAGTTSLYYYLRQHPDIFMSPIKETNFFAYDVSTIEEFTNLTENDFPVKSIVEYQKLFLHGDHKKAIGEASPRYLWQPTAPLNIKKYIPDAKLIVIFRNPVQRAFSGYLMYFSQGREKRSFSQAIDDEIKMSESGKWPLGRMTYISLGFYSKQLSNYFQYFDRDQFKIILYDDYKSDLDGTLHQVFKFLDVGIIQLRSLPRHNVSGLPKSRLVHFLLKPRKMTKTIRRYLPQTVHDPIFNYFMGIKERNMMKPLIESDIRRKLIGIFREDILLLQDLIDRDLTSWLN